MCLQSCPTYLKTLDEGESPRGRISLIQGMISGQLKSSAKLVAHLDSCLKCRACEDICPSDVPYGTIIDIAHDHIESHYKRGALYQVIRKSGLALVKKPILLAMLFSLLRLYQRCGFQWLAIHSGLTRFAQLNKTLPVIPPKLVWQTYYPAKNTHQGDVGLFIGCIANSLDQQTLQSSINVITQLGYGIHVPQAQGCCGALHQHNGERQQATTLIEKNKHAFGQLKISAIITTASGCGAVLKEDTIANEQEAKVIDINTFLAKINWPENIRLQPLNKTVAIQDPCSLRRVWREHNNPYEILKKIPSINLISLAQNDRCCGAAGSYMLTHPQMAKSLRDDKLSALQKQPVDILATANIGCALHLAAGLREKQINMEVVHPIVLIDRQIKN